jgi:hypothetical protein
MRIYEILFWNNEPNERNRSDPELDFPPGQFGGDPTKLANAFTRSGLVKHFWNINGSEGQPSGPAPPDETTSIPNGTLEPTTVPLQAEPVEQEPAVSQHRLVPFRQY